MTGLILFGFFFKGEKMKYTINITLNTDEIKSALRQMALSKLDLGRPFNLDSAKVNLRVLPLGLYEATVQLEDE